LFYVKIAQKHDEKLYNSEKSGSENQKVLTNNQLLIY